MALLDLGRYICTERSPFRLILIRFIAALHSLPKDLDRNAATSNTITVPGHFSDGSCHYRQHGGFRMCSGVGT